MAGSVPQALRITVRYLLLIFAVVVLNFLLPRLLPGSPLTATSGEGLDIIGALPAETAAQLARYYRLDQPLGIQFASYLADLLHGDLGWSIARSAPVGRLLLDRLPWTLGLLGSALLLSALGGTALGLLAGWRPGGARDRIMVSLTAAISAIPEFLLAIGLLLVFSITLGWFPLSGGQTLFTVYSSDLNGTLQNALDIAWHLTLPSLALVLAGSAGFMLLTRDLTAGLRQEQWLMVARAKGLSERQIAFRHLMPNVVPALATFFGLRLGALFGGALVIERVFNVPGLGLLAFEALRARDYPVLQALFLLSSVGIIAANYAVELLYLRLDRRRALRRG